MRLQCVSKILTPRKMRSFGDDGATNHHYQHRHGHQLQTVVTWVLDELERNQKKGKSSKNNSQDDGHLSSGPAEHV